MSALRYAAIAFVIGALTAPAPAADTVFHADQSQVWDQFRHGGGLNDIVANRNLPDKLAWRFSVPRKGTSASPVVAGGLVLVASNDKSLYAVDARTGKPVWTWKGDNQVMSAPVYRDGITVIGTGNGDSPVWDPPAYNLVGMGASDLNGIDLQTGKRRWSVALTGSGMPMPALLGRTLLHVDGSGVFLALDVRTGAYRWRRLLYSNASMTNVLLEKGVAYFGGRFPNIVYALRATDGTTLWMHAFPARDGAFDDCPLATDGSQIFGMYSSPLSTAPGAIILEGVEARQHVYALDARTGRLRWDSALAVTGKEPSYNESAIPMYDAGTLYDGSPIAPIVTALDARTGRAKWSLRVAGPVKGGMVLRDGVLYFGDLGGKLWAVDVAAGRPLGSIQTDLKFNVGSPIILNDSLVIGSAGGPTIAVPLENIQTSKPIAAITTAQRSSWTLLALTLAVIALVLLQMLRQTLRSRRPALRGR